MESNDYYINDRMQMHHFSRFRATFVVAFRATKALMIRVAATLTKTSPAIQRNYNQPTFAPKIRKIAVTTWRWPALRVSQTAAQSSRDFITFFLREAAAHTEGNKYTYETRTQRDATGRANTGNIRDFLSEERLRCKWTGNGGRSCRRSIARYN